MASLAEIDGALAAMPASPTTDKDLEARAALVRSRCEIISENLSRERRKQEVPRRVETDTPAHRLRNQR